MIKTRIAAFAGCIVLSLLIIGCSKVATGDVVTCRTCGRQILNTVQYVTVPFWKTSEYRVSNALSYCEVCGNQQIPYKIHVQCRHCGKEYEARTAMAARKLEKRDEWLTEGYCSLSCGVLGAAGEFIDTLSEGVGRLFGKVDKGLQKGFEKSHE